mmetsp:Transcript_29542/g.98728  ORF Transcript_29542/g.98728 Transcript_29542/m.98728 type:complete len:226 (+) Transcript_29542:57-734(+)
MKRAVNSAARESSTHKTHYIRISVIIRERKSASYQFDEIGFPLSWDELGPAPPELALTTSCCLAALEQRVSRSSSKVVESLTRHVAPLDVCCRCVSPWRICAYQISSPSPLSQSSSIAPARLLLTCRVTAEAGSVEAGSPGAPSSPRWTCLPPSFASPAVLSIAATSSFTRSPGDRDSSPCSCASRRASTASSLTRRVSTSRAINSASAGAGASARRDSSLVVGF